MDARTSPETGTRAPGTRRTARRLPALLLLVPVLLAGLSDRAEAQALQVTGQILYGTAANAHKGGTVDVVAVYASNPAYMRMRANGLSETDQARGTRLFNEAQGAANRALAKVAKANSIDVITIPGGVEGGEAVPVDVTAQVIDQLPLYCVEGKVLAGNARDARVLVQLDPAQLWNAIPAWREAQLLTQNDANYHFLMKQAADQFERAVKKVLRDGGYDGIVETGGVTGRLGPVADVTAAAISAIGS